MRPSDVLQAKFALLSGVISVGTRTIVLVAAVLATASPLNAQSGALPAPAEVEESEDAAAEPPIATPSAGPRREREPARAFPVPSEPSYGRRVERTRAASPWHGGRWYVQAQALSAIPFGLRFGHSRRYGLAAGLELSVQPFIAFAYSARNGLHRPRGVFSSASLSAFVSRYLRVRWLHVDAGLGVAIGSLDVALDDGSNVVSTGRGGRAFVSIGAEWHHSESPRQHWGLGLALTTGASYLVSTRDRSLQVDVLLATTATWF